MMNFIEAIQIAKNSGKPIKRNAWADSIQLFVIHEPKDRNDEILVYHATYCVIPLTATDVLAQDWELIYQLPSWFRDGQKIIHNYTQAMYKIIDIGVKTWSGYNNCGDECTFPLMDIEKNWSPVE